MKETVLITVGYTVEIELDDFWNRNESPSHYNEEVLERLKKRFPMKMKIKDNHYAKRICIKTLPISSPASNALKCPRCNRWMIDTTKPDHTSPLQRAMDVEGTLYCSGCGHDVLGGW